VRPRRLREAAGLLALLAVGACQARPAADGGAAPPASSAPEPDSGVAGMIDRGDADGALARLEGKDDPESLYLQGRAWAKKAESAPLPTPPPPLSPLPKGAPLPGPPEFKPEEHKAIELLERAVAAQPDLAAAHLALAQVLAPHALRFHEREKDAQARQALRRPSRHATPEPLPTPEPGVDYSTERVVREYGLAVRGDSSRAPVEAMIAFAVKAGRLDEAEAGYQELIRRLKERAEPMVLYGDFLVQEKKQPVAAMEQYRQALIWSPNDETIRGKLAGIFLSRGVEFFDQQQYALAEVQFAEAAKYIPDRNSPQGQILTEHLAKLREIRLR
jgi:tetratricopeptide (TPR) repeat protein